MWWVIEDRALHDALQRAHDGEDPWLVEAELYANSEVDRRDDEEPTDDLA
jgi:hypothetical protein